MKILLLLILPVAAFSQKTFFSLDGQFYKNEIIVFAGGADLTIGGVVNNTFHIGPGVGVYFFDGDRPYVPVFVSAGYLSVDKKVSPYGNVRVGYGFYSGSGYFIDAPKSNRGGIYSNFRAGASFKLSKLHLTPFIAGTLLQLTYKGPNIASQGSSYRDTETYNKFLPNAGVSLFVLLR